eukprot:2733854-Amphidinium_carterae.1
MTCLEDGQISEGDLCSFFKGLGPACFVSVHTKTNAAPTARHQPTEYHSNTFYDVTVHAV